MNDLIANRDFVKRMSAAELWLQNCEDTDDSDYLHAYCFGLRRHYHGKRFGSDAEVSAFLTRGGASRDGLEAGLAGAMFDMTRFGSECGGQNGQKEL